ncbi:MAG TPA: patatin-like phospholipase family protein, partial [Bryobacteraceae bacterium]|nr:patatin-like phospholipase family protein [Bryobacteraceae bacterium]
RLVVPSYSLGEDDVYIFRTPHHEKLARDQKVSAWKVARATSAAPTYFPSFRGVDGLRLIDGGVWANNPTMVALVEAFGTLHVPLASIRILSLGTTDDLHARNRKLDSAGYLGYRRAAAEIFLRGQAIAARNQARFLVGQENLYRVDPVVPAFEFNLDGIDRSEDLIAKAAYYSRNFAPHFKALFLPHTAELFVPAATSENPA